MCASILLTGACRSLKVTELRQHRKRCLNSERLASHSKPTSTGRIQQLKPKAPILLQCAVCSCLNLCMLCCILHQQLEPAAQGWRIHKNSPARKYWGEEQDSLTPKSTQPKKLIWMNLFAQLNPSPAGIIILKLVH